MQYTGVVMAAVIATLVPIALELFHSGLRATGHEIGRDLTQRGLKSLETQDSKSCDTTTFAEVQARRRRYFPKRRRSFSRAKHNFGNRSRQRFTRQRY